MCMVNPNLVPVFGIHLGISQQPKKTTFDTVTNSLCMPSTYQSLFSSPYWPIQVNPELPQHVVNAFTRVGKLYALTADMLLSDR